MAKPKVKTNRGKIGAGWSREFYDPIPLPCGRQLVTLKDAGTYITKLPKAEQKLAEWQTAMQALLLVVEQNGPTMFARIGVTRALHRNVERVFNPDRKDLHWGKRKLKRDPFISDEIHQGAVKWTPEIGPNVKV
jgi:hypothetical protein